MANATSTPVTPPVGPATPPGMGVNEQNPTLPPRTQPTPEAAPDMGAPTSTGPVTINTPTPIAGAQAPPRPVSKRGMMASVLTGALEGAKTAMKKSGEAAKQAAQNSSLGRKIRQDNATREETETRTAQMQQQTTDAHQETQLRMVGISMDNIAKAQTNAYQEQNIPLELQKNRLQIMSQWNSQNQETLGFLSTLEQAGIHIDASHFKEGGPFDNLTIDHAKNAGDGSQVMIHNGLTGLASDLGIISLSELANTILKTDTPVLSDWTLDASTGQMKPIYKTLPGGKSSALDALVSYKAAMDKYSQYQGRYVQQLQAEETIQKAKDEAASAGEKGALGEKDRAEAKVALMQAGVGDTSKNGEDYVETLPPVMQDLVRGLLRYQIRPTDLGRSTDRKTVIAAALHADTTGQWSEARYEERYNFLKEYGSTTSGYGAQRDRVNTAIGHLSLLAQASQYLAQNNLMKLNEIANAIGVQTGQNSKIVYDSIAQKASGEAAGAIKGGSGAATDTEIEAVRKNFDSSQSPQQQMGNFKAQFQLINTQVATQEGHFAEVMQTTSSDFGQPLLLPENAKILQQWVGSIPPGSASGVPVTIKGKSYPTNSDGTFYVDGNKYKVNPDGKGASLVVGE